MDKPTLDKGTGFYNEIQSVFITNYNEDYSYVVTKSIDGGGSGPKEKESSYNHSTGIRIDCSCELIIKSEDNSGNSAIETFSFGLKPKKPELENEEGTYSKGVEFKIKNIEKDINYYVLSLNGNIINKRMVNGDSLYFTPGIHEIELGLFDKPLWNDAVYSFTFNVIQALPDPIIELPANKTISTETNLIINTFYGSTLKYVLDGSEIASKDDGEPYPSNGLSFEVGSVELAVRAFKDGFVPSNRMEYQITVKDVPDEVDFVRTESGVVFKNLLEGEKIIYTKNGSSPSSTGKEYTVSDSVAGAVVTFPSGGIPILAKKYNGCSYGKFKAIFSNKNKEKEFLFPELATEGSLNKTEGDYVGNLFLQVKKEEGTEVLYKIDDEEIQIANSIGNNALILIPCMLKDGKIIKKGLKFKRELTLFLSGAFGSKELNYIFNIYNIPTFPSTGVTKLLKEFTKLKTSVSSIKVKGLGNIFDDLKDDLEYYLSDFEGEVDAVIQFLNVDESTKEKASLMLEKYQLSEVPALLELYSSTTIFTKTIRELQEIQRKIYTVQKQKNAIERKMFFDETSFSIPDRWMFPEFSKPVSGKVIYSAYSSRDLFPVKKKMVTIIADESKLAGVSNEEIRKSFFDRELLDGLICIYGKGIVDSKAVVSNRVIDKDPEEIFEIKEIKRI